MKLFWYVHVPVYEGKYATKVHSLMKEVIIFFEWKEWNLSPWFFPMTSLKLVWFQWAMLNHWSQFVWFRALYIIFSRYMLMNTLQEILPQDVCASDTEDEENPPKQNTQMMVKNQNQREREKTPRKQHTDDGQEPKPKRKRKSTQKTTHRWWPRTKTKQKEKTKENSIEAGRSLVYTSE